MAVTFSDAELDAAFDSLKVRVRDLSEMRKSGNWPDDPAVRAVLHTNVHYADQLRATALIIGGNDILKSLLAARDQDLGCEAAWPPDPLLKSHARP